MRNLNENNLEACFRIKNALYGFIVMTHTKFDACDRASHPGDWHSAIAEIYRAVADFFGVDEVTDIVPDGKDNQIIFFKDVSVARHLPKDTFEDFCDRVTREQNAAAFRLLQALIAGTSETEIQKALLDVVVAVCADKNDLGELGEKYFTKEHVMIPNRLDAILHDIRQRIGVHISIEGEDVPMQIILASVYTCMLRYDVPPCIPYFAVKDDGTRKPCYAVGRCRQRHCTCPN